METFVTIFVLVYLSVGAIILLCTITMGAMQEEGRKHQKEAGYGEVLYAISIVAASLWILFLWVTILKIIKEKRSKNNVRRYNHQQAVVGDRQPGKSTQRGNRSADV